MFNGLYIDENGNKYWYKDDRLHNENGPAVEYPDGSKIWCINGKYHRLDGPAVEYSDGRKFWYINDKRIDYSSQKEFETYIKRLVLL